MKSAYSIIEENRIRSLFLFLTFGIIIVLMGFIVLYITESLYISLFILLYGLFYSFINLFVGDRILTWLTGAHKIDRSFNEDVYRMVENLSIAAGLVKMPEIYLIETDEMNAFAVGTKGNDYKVVLTRGIIENLERSELEGVIAHEISHIKNYDTRLMTWAVILVGAVGLIAEILLRFQIENSNKRDKSSGSIIPIIIVISAILFPIFATLIKLSISRKREFMADSTAALLTRNPLALARALEKISQSSQRNFQKLPQFSSLFIINPFNKEGSILDKINNLFSTHPPVEERIKLLRGMLI